MLELKPMRYNKIGRESDASHKSLVEDKASGDAINLEELYLMCIDPRTKKKFRINMGEQTAQEVTFKKEKDIPNKIERDIYKIDELLERKEHEDNWNFQNDTVNDYRRRMVPFYLLGEESN